MIFKNKKVWRLKNTNALNQLNSRSGATLTKAQFRTAEQWNYKKHLWYHCITCPNDCSIVRAFALPFHGHVGEF